MTGPALVLQLLLLIGWFGLIILLLIYTIIRRRSHKKSIPSGLLFLSLTFLSSYVYYRIKQSDLKIAKKFWGDYKLEKLDRKNCEGCKVRLNEGYSYDIIVNDKVVGQGKWSVGNAIDIPGAFLEIENGPTYVVWESDRLIQYIDRTPNK